MKHFRLPAFGGLIILLLTSGRAAAQSGELEPATAELLSYQDRITIPFLRDHLVVISADSMEGRETGTAGQKKAADYLAAWYSRTGLQPIGPGDSYFQDFELGATSRDSTVFELYEGETLIDRSTESLESTGNFNRSFGGEEELSGEILFAGFGVNDPARGVAHLRSRNLRGKWVMVFEEIPHVVDGDTLVDPARNTQNRFQTILSEQQAEGILIIPSMTEEEYEEYVGRYQQVYTAPANLSLEYLQRDSGEGFSRGYNVVRPSMAARILGLENGMEGLSRYRQSLVDDITGFEPFETGFSLVHTPYSSRTVVDTENVGAIFEGGDPALKEEVIVLTAHYDHVGIGQPDASGDRIYNGADDDGSGTVALLNIAHALTEAAAAGHRPKRSILFLHVSAEEIGLLGSRYYSDHPVVPIDQTVANINIDMIGRIDPDHAERGIADYSYIIGSEIISSELDSLLKVANAESGQIELDKSYNDLEDPNQFYRRSDHWNFGRLGVPFIFFFTGVHEDYHRPSDEIEKIRFEKMAKIIRTIYATTVVVANSEEPPAVDNQEFIDITRSLPR